MQHDCEPTRQTDAFKCHRCRNNITINWNIMRSVKYDNICWTKTTNVEPHDDVIKWKLVTGPLVWGIHWWPVNSPHKGQWRRALLFSLICTWINGWVNNREAGDLRRHRAHNGTETECCRDHVTETLSSLVAPKIVITTTTGVTNDDKVDIIDNSKFSVLGKTSKSKMHVVGISMRFRNIETTEALKWQTTFRCIKSM